EYAMAQAVCARAMAGSGLRGPRAGVYGVDKTSAHCFSQVQMAEHYTGCYPWPDDEGRVRQTIGVGTYQWPSHSWGRPRAVSNTSICFGTSMGERTSARSRGHNFYGRTYRIHSRRRGASGGHTSREHSCHQCGLSKAVPQSR
ncbi:MAG: hypothetical protein SGPRY_009185, partial [Prymnesium sp.]